MAAPYDLGNYSFLADPSSSPPESSDPSARQDHSTTTTSATSTTVAHRPTAREVNYETGPTALYRAIENREWTSAIGRARHCPSEAGTWVYRLGGDGETVRWKVLPLHQACAREPPPSVIYALLAAHPDAASSYHPLPTNGDSSSSSITAGALPLHYAAQWGASVEVVRILLAAYPHGMFVRDNRGLLAEDIAKLSKYPNRDAVVQTLEEGRLEYEAEEKRLEAESSRHDDAAASGTEMIGEEMMVPLNASFNEDARVGGVDDEEQEQESSGAAAAVASFQRGISMPRVRSRMTMHDSMMSTGSQSGRSTPSEFSRTMSMDEADPTTEQLVLGEGWREAGLIVVVVGASGDLAKKKTYPSLLNLYDDNLLPDDVIIWGFARSALSHEDLRGRLKPYLLKSGDHDESVVDEFLSRCYYKRGSSYGDLDAFAELSKGMDKYEASFPNRHEHNRLFYLAIPPNVFAQTGIAIKKTSMAPRGWSRVIVEKPFGRDLASCEELLGLLSEQFDESQMFRIDHYLGKEMVSNLIVLRFGNLWFERLWNRNDVQCVMITFKESFGCDGRGGYFDQFGIIRDVVQNHLLQVLTLLAMEPPIKADGPEAGEKIRDAKVAVLKSIPPITLDECLLGQYEGYADDPTIENKDTNTPTFVCMRAFVHTPRWAGVPFIFKAGKALNERRAEVRIQFRDAPAADFMFDTRCPRNELVLRIQPSESIYIKTNVKSPGFQSDPIQGELEVNYDKRFYESASESNPDAYTRLILDVLRGRSAAFVRDDELKRAWEIFTPLLHQIERDNVRPHIYKRGSRGPTAADAFINARSGYIRNSDYTYYDHKPSRKSKPKKKAGVSEIGVWGMAVMGQNFALNMASKGLMVCVGNRSPSKVQRVIHRAKKEGIHTLTGSSDAADFIKRLSKPRKVVILVMAGKPVDETIAKLSEHMEAGDVIIGGGNEWYTNSIRRSMSLASRGILFMGMGMSGGEEGARNGPSLMPGGPKEAYDLVSDILISCAAEVNGSPCVSYIGPIGSGNYVKMVHNGIEYGDMQLIAEIYDIMKHVLCMSNEEMAAVFEDWNRGVLASYLIEITAKILARKDDVTGAGYLVDYILDKTGSKGTGRWAVQESAEQNVASPTIAASLDSRYISSQKDERTVASKVLKGPAAPQKVNKKEMLGCLGKALYASKICSYAQGFNLVKDTSDAMSWDINLSECARIWKGGCIIRAKLLGKIQSAYLANPDLPNLMVDPTFAAILVECAESWRKIVITSMNSGISCPALASSLNYFDSYRRDRLPANLTQAQRDFFGGHSFQRIDREGNYHVAWTDTHKDIGDVNERKLGEQLAANLNLDGVPAQ
mmetsp:Transcript_27538/g.60331  ORF Transcript_27538/g.60331 Transcript_27538/m.60331 type:complete len:1339 (+) Transcript_27538:180-4196(+)|eukprot:CAMPEP_0178471622 /NCGR_PEP_ID=MMETSP0696-20121128/1139_1 /TAXON_ID=265572 /ORGANISM="Extubocellulus spinifer, Strain CCMP396" /LENGTH=1338 /DNA_ID=CAMNT_0020098765 /DNA_START=119 /DNA_END=4135 /DNA_ORIENTATION=+